MTAIKGLGTYGDAVGVVTPLDHKIADASLIAKAALTAVRPGLFWGGTANIVTGTAGMAYSVAAYHCVTTRGATAGVVLGGNDGTLSVSTTAAPGSNSRYDVVYHWHREFSLDGTDSNPVIGVIQGTASASPTVPSLASYPGAIELARILVPSGVTATNSGTTITQTAPFTTVDGGVVVARTTTERDAYSPAAADTKALCWVIADGITYKWNGSAWKAWESDWITTNPTITAESGTFTNVSGSLMYKFSAGVIVFDCTVTITTAGTASGAVFVPLPYTASGTWIAFGRETAATGVSLSGTIASAGAQMNIINYTNSTVIANGRTAVLSGMYRPA